MSFGITRNLGTTRVWKLKHGLESAGVTVMLKIGA